jgi:hypothetical protein
MDCRNNTWREFRHAQISAGVKSCGKCLESKLLTEFYTTSRHIDGRAGWCKVCRRQDEKRRRSDARLIQKHNIRYEHDLAFRARTMLRSTAKRAKKLGKAFDLDDAWLVDRLARGCCELSGLPFRLDAAVVKRHAFSPSIDRIDTKSGYVSGNCRVILFALNVSLGSWGMQVYMDLAEAMLKRHRLAVAS